LGCTEAYNLDGGGSSTMYFLGRVVNNPLGRNKERGTSDILFISADA
jgi:exopolysaccharide biosynthesis protein